MGIIELLGLAASVSLLSGWRLYLTVFATGLAMQSGYVDLPENLVMLDALSSWWVIGIAGLGAVAEFFADKVAWLDSIWDGLHTLLRPLGGALLSLAVVDSGDPTWQVIAFLLGGGCSVRQPRHKGHCARGGEYFARAGEQCRGLHRRRCRDRRAAIARIRQPRGSGNHRGRAADTGDMGAMERIPAIPGVSFPKPDQTNAG